MSNKFNKTDAVAILITVAFALITIGVMWYQDRHPQRESYVSPAGESAEYSIPQAVLELDNHTEPPRETFFTDELPGRDEAYTRDYEPGANELNRDAFLG